MKIESDDVDIESLLSGRYFFIPRFQRPYSWDDDNILDFWNDLVETNGRDYFIGSMVVYRKSKQEFGVVDGQQRLTTVTILLCVLRDAFQDLGQFDLASGLHQMVERKNRDNRNEYVVRTETSFPYFQENIQKFGPPELAVEEFHEEKKLKNAHSLFRHKIGSVLEAVDHDASVADGDKAAIKVRKLRTVRDALLNLNLIFVVLENEDDAYLIFETLNTRGKDLAVTDLVKNLFTKHLKSKSSVDQARIKWERVLETIHNSSADISSDTFIQHFWASREETVPVKKLFPVIKKKISKDNAAYYLDALVADSRYYRSIHEPGYMWDKNEGRAAHSLRAMQLFKLAQPTPTTLSLVRAYREKKIKLGKLSEALSAIEKFHFAFTAVTSSRSSGGMTAMYSATARRLFEAKDSNEASREVALLLEKLRQRRPSFDEFLVAFREIRFTNSNSKQKNLVRYILRKFSEHFSYKFPVDFDDLTIEHLAPQSLLQNGDSWDERAIGSLGNLILLDQATNEMLDTADFRSKKQLLLDAQHSLPKFVLDTDEWTSESVAKHTDEMAKVAYTQIWDI